MLTPGAVCQRPTSRSGSGNGSGFSSTLSTTLKMAVLAPIPSASVTSVASVKAGVRSRRRAACRTSRIRSNMAESFLTRTLRTGHGLVHCPAGKAKAT